MCCFFHLVTKGGFVQIASCIYGGIVCKIQPAAWVVTLISFPFCWHN
ncbi:hypothetical protein PVAP13_7NG010400 [Panicum virgatum]|uniref:Uncharacterized protein n=1 Tax=Panicum virgatum TaxID=38727 RepID=A0A8T0PR71_PANVG|nr:hypothetical protein PVAP13_7NG010400 [Panicum virgatum]